MTLEARLLLLDDMTTGGKWVRDGDRVVAHQHTGGKSTVAQFATRGDADLAATLVQAWRTGQLVFVGDGSMVQGRRGKVFK